MTPTLLHLLDQEVERFRYGICHHPLLSKLIDGSVTMEQYIGILRQLYSLDATVNRLPLVAAKEDQPSKLAGLLAERYTRSYREETGHEAVISRDLRLLAAGSPARDPACDQFFRDLIAGHPERWLGIGYLLEVTAARLFGQVHQALIVAKQIPQQALNWLQLHAVVDLEHAVYWQQTIEQADPYLTLTEKRSIAAVARQVTEYVLSRYAVTVPQPRYIVRPARLDDLPTVLAIERQAIDFAPVDLECLRCRYRVCPAGFLVAVDCSGQIKAYFQAIQVDWQAIQHNWRLDTADGTCLNHNPEGTELYGVTVASVGHGTLRPMLQALYSLAAKRGLENIHIHSRLPHFARSMASRGLLDQGSLRDHLDEYVEFEEDGLMRYYLRLGLRPIGGIVDYSPEDRESLGCAAWLTWP